MGGNIFVLRSFFSSMISVLNGFELVREMYNSSQTEYDLTVAKGD